MLVLGDVLVSGHFRTVHSDHIKLFEYASIFGNVTVGINGNYYHQEKYGAASIPVEDRAYIIRSCRYVDNVIIFEEETPAELIARLKPRYYVKGPDYRDIEISEQRICNELNVTILYRPGWSQYSSSALAGILK